MEALAVLGAVVNIAQALEYGFKLLQKSKSLRKLGVIDPDLNDDVWRLKKIAASLSSEVLPNSHEDLRNLAVKCAEVSRELISELEKLEKLKPTNPKSKRQRFKAIYKSELRRSHISQLRKRLNSHETQLSRHLASVARIDFNGKLDEIGQDVHKITSELAGMQFVMKDLSDSAHIGHEISKTLHSLVQHYHDRFGQSSERAILDKLHFPNMHERFDTILDAHEETLRWVFDPAGGDCAPKEKAGKDFIAWLRQGSSFFHISGKPGAGKSTMMKYICSHEDLDNHLKVWCQGARLGCGQFFFWMPGTAEQKSLKGLLRGLLHSILVQNRDLIPTALPDLWNLMLTHSSSSRELEYRDFQQGFDNILKHASHSRLYKFVLFIDGLDEFEGRHLDLISTLKEWTEKYYSVLKICVSSREYIVFQQSFSPYPKLRLHECTSTDIERMVSTHLKSNPQYVDLFTSDQPQTIVNLITTRAEGVFLWVSIVLASIEDALISGASFRELEKRIEAYPTELDPLYWHLVHLTHETDRKWTFRALKMVQFYQSIRKEVYYREEVYDRDDVYYVETWWLSLLGLSFLEDMQYGDAATAAFTKALTLEPMTAAQRLDNTYKKVYGRCKGLLHVRVDPNLPLETPPTMKQQVVFIHRSIVEFLETSDFVKMARPYLHDFDCFDNACGALLQCIKYQRPVPDVFCEGRPYGKFIHGFWTRTFRIYASLAARLGRVTSETFLYRLEAFREAILTLSERLEDEHSILESTNRYFALTGLMIGLWEPLKRMQDNNPQLSPYPFSNDDILGSCQRFHTIGARERWSHVTQDRFITVLDCFLSLGFNLNYKCYIGSSWKSIILGFMANLFPQNWCPGVVIDWCLRHGADPDFIVGQFVPHGPRSLPWLNQKDGWQLFLAGSHVDFSFSRPCWLYDGEYLFIMNETTHLCQRIKKNGGALKLRDLLSYWFPDNEYFPNLIDGLQSGKGRERTDSILLSSEVEEPPGQIVRRTWETDYIVNSQEDILKVLEGRGINREELDDQLHLPTSNYSDDGSRVRSSKDPTSEYST